MNFSKIMKYDSYFAFSTLTLSSFQASCTPRYDIKLLLISNFNCINYQLPLTRNRVMPFPKKSHFFTKQYVLALALALSLRPRHKDMTLISTHASYIFA